MARLTYEQAMDAAVRLSAAMIVDGGYGGSQRIVDRAAEMVCRLEDAMQKEFAEDAEPVASEDRAEGVH